MEQLKRSVASARRRLLVQQFLAIAPWCLFATLLLALIGLVVPKLWFLNLDMTLWQWSWLGAGWLLGLTLALVVTYVRSCTALDAAIEFDRRCGLKERVSSALSLSGDELDSEAGRALVKDASDRVEVLRVSDIFHISAGRRLLLPLLPLLAMLGLLFVPNAAQESAQASTAAAQLQQQIKKTTEELEKRLAKHKQRSQQNGLEDAEELFKKLQQGLDELESDQDVDRRKALVKMNDLAKEVEKRRNALGDSDKMKQQFSRLKDLKRGPAEKVAGALKDGDFQKALEELRKLAEQMKQGDLTAEEREQLAQQLEQMKKTMQEMVEAHQQAKEELKRQIEQKERDGDLESAGRLQRQLDALESMDRQMERMERMANQLEQAEESMRNENSSEAAAQLDQLASELEEMQSEMQQLETLSEMMSEIAMAKDMMDGQQPLDGYSPSMSSMEGFQEGPGDGMGEGQGAGYRPEEETATGEYRARERAQPKAGEAVRIGDAFGPNRAGMTQEEIKQHILGSLKGETDPLTDQRLPRSQQDHVRQYYQRLSEGQ